MTVAGGYVPRDHVGWMWDLTVPGNNDHDFYIDTTIATILVHNVGGMNGCSDAAYQGVLHINDEVAHGSLDHDLVMTDDGLADYLDNYANTQGQRLLGGAQGWYGAQRGVMIIQRSEYSMTAFKTSMSYFRSQLAG